MPFKRRRARPKFLSLVVVVCILVALAALAVTWFMRSFTSYDPQHYGPSELEREEQLLRESQEQQER